MTSRAPSHRIVMTNVILEELLDADQRARRLIERLTTLAEGQRSDTSELTTLVLAQQLIIQALTVRLDALEGKL